MKRRFSRVLVVTMLVLVLATIPVMPAFAATDQDVTVTAKPSFIAIANAPSTWTINGLTGSGVIVVDTIYYSNPLGDTTVPSDDPIVDGECRFTITNTSTVAVDLTVNFPNHAGGDASTNNDDGANAAGAFGAYSYFSGDNFSDDKVVAKAAASDAAYGNLSAVTNIKWGLMYESQTDAWTSGDNMTSTVNIAATTT